MIYSIIGSNNNRYAIRYLHTLLLLLVELSCIFLEILINYKHSNYYRCSNRVDNVKYVLNFNDLLLLVSKFIFHNK